MMGPVEDLPDERVLALCGLQMDEGQQRELSDLLAAQREGELDDTMRQRLDKLMMIYRKGMLLKAQAFKVAVERGLCSPLDGGS